MIIFKKINESFYKVEAEKDIIYKMRDEFAFFSENAKYDPRYKAKQWDGKIRLLNLVGNTIPVGIKHKLVKFCVDNKYQYAFQPSYKQEKIISDEEADSFIESLNISINDNDVSLHDFQRQAFIDCINDFRKIILSATSSGKTLMIYCIVRFLLEHVEGRICISLPNVGLVEQLYSDFKNYSSKTTFDVDEHFQLLYSGKDKKLSKRVLITTWQSIYKNEPEYFEQFHAFIGDEAHTCDAKSLTKIINQCINAYYRIGFSGTLKESKVHVYQLESLFGPEQRVSKTSDLVKRDIVTPVKIIYTTLKYSEADSKKVLSFKGKTPIEKYHNEVKFVNAHVKRREYIVNKIINTPGNCLVLFIRKEEQGEILFNELTELNEKLENKRNIYYISGNVKPKERERIRKEIDSHHESILIASYGTTSTGISMNRINNIFFPNAYATDIKTNQSIGRGLRKYVDKNIVVIYDYLDDLSNKNTFNYLFNHFEKRLQNYISEEFDYEFTYEDLNVEGK